MNIRGAKIEKPDYALIISIVSIFVGVLFMYNYILYKLPKLLVKYRILISLNPLNLLEINSEIFLLMNKFKFVDKFGEVFERPDF